MVRIVRKTLLDYFKRMDQGGCVEKVWDDPGNPDIYYRYYECNGRKGFGIYKRLPRGEINLYWFWGGTAREKAKEYGFVRDGVLE